MRTLGWSAVPNPVDQAIRGHDAARVDQKQRKQCALLRPADPDQPGAIGDFELAEDSKFHSPPPPRRPSRLTRAPAAMEERPSSRKPPQGSLWSVFRAPEHAAADK